MHADATIGEFALLASARCHSARKWAGLAVTRLRCLSESQRQERRPARHTSRRRNPQHRRQFDDQSSPAALAVPQKVAATGAPAVAIRSYRFSSSGLEARKKRWHHTTGQ